MTLDKFKSTGRRIISPLVSVVVKIGITPNQISVIAFLVASGAAALYYVATPIAYIAGAFAVATNGFLDVLDGEVARETGEESDKGDFLDHVLDRYSDLIIIIGITAGTEAWAVGILALSGVFMTSYMGTQAQAVGAGREYSGIIGRADRLVIIGFGGFIQAYYLETGMEAINGYSPLGWILIFFAVAGHLTALQRFVMTWRDFS